MAERNPPKSNIPNVGSRAEDRIRRAFLESVATIKSEAQVSQIAEAIAAGRFERAIELLNLEPGYFSPLVLALQGAFVDAGREVVGSQVALANRRGAKVRGAFNAGNERSQEFLRRQSSERITEVIEDQKVAVRRLLSANSARQTAPRTTALDIVGRINRATGRREGGIIGVHSQDAQKAANALDELLSDPRTSEGQARLRNYLKRQTRAKRYDAEVERALASGSRINSARARQAVVGMENNLLRGRGETIARTELVRSTNAAQKEALDQMTEGGKVRKQYVTRTWDAAGDGFARDSHAEMDGQERGPDEPFTTGRGYSLMFPGDTSLGAPASETINCRCVVRTSVDWVAEAADRERERV